MEKRIRGTTEHKAAHGADAHDEAALAKRWGAGSLGMCDTDLSQQGSKVLGYEGSGGRARAPWFNNFYVKNGARKFMATPDFFFEKCFVDKQCDPDKSGLQRPVFKADNPNELDVTVLKTSALRYCLARVDVRLSADPARDGHRIPTFAPGVDGLRGYLPHARAFLAKENFRAFVAPVSSGDRWVPHPNTAVDFTWAKVAQGGQLLKALKGEEAVLEPGVVGRFLHTPAIASMERNHLKYRQSHSDHRLVDPVLTPARRYFLMANADAARWDDVRPRVSGRDSGSWRQAVRGASGGDVRLLRGRPTELGGRLDFKPDEHLGDNGTDGLHGRDGRHAGFFVLEVRQEPNLALGPEFRRGTFKLHAAGERGGDGMIGGDGDLGKRGKKGSQSIEGMYSGYEDLRKRPPPAVEAAAVAAITVTQTAIQSAFVLLGEMNVR